MADTVTLQFILENTLSSDLIAWFSQGHFSHVDAVMADGRLLGAKENRVKTEEGVAIPAGVYIRPADYTQFIHQVRFTIPVMRPMAVRWNAFLRQQIGKPYDWLSIAAFVTGRNWRSKDSWICSELQAAALEDAGIVPRLYLSANKITPVSLALAISAIPGVQVENVK